MKKIIIGTLLLLSIGSGIAYFLMSSKTSEQKMALLISTEQPKGGDFTLNSSKGKVSLHDFKGKVLLVYFGYTFCPDICPTNLGNMSMAYQQLSPIEKQKVQILFISVDPVRDTPKRLQEYVNYFAMNALGLTADKSTISELAKRYGVVYKSHQKNEADDMYPVDHSAFTYVINQQGQLVTQLPHATSPEIFTKTIRQLLP